MSRIQINTIEMLSREALLDLALEFHSTIRFLESSRKPLSNHITENYGTVYNAAKQTGKSETQLHRWIKKGALIDSDGNVWTKPSGGNLNVAR